MLTKLGNPYSTKICSDDNWYRCASWYGKYITI